VTPRLLALGLALVAGTAVAAERFGVVVGANQGGGSRPRLWYAEKDAERFAATLRELGDFDERHLHLLQGPTAPSVLAALAQAEQDVARARAVGQRTLLVFYFSGHASAGALELGGERLDFATLKALVERSAADVKVAIVDACESGGLTQVKGARPSSVDFVLPTDETARGVAYLASTAAGEVAQESAVIGASFFTFHLEAAMRGAGDANGDGQVSLTEAFHYTSSRTITGTSATAAGPQHPTYNFRMAGRGDVVLSDLRRAESRLALPGSADATWVLSQKGRLVAEAPGGLTLALPAGEYRVERHHDGLSAGGDVTLVPGQLHTVGPLVEARSVAQQKGGMAERPNLLYAGGSVDAPLVVGQALPVGARLGFRRALGPLGLRAELGYSEGSGTLTGGQSVRLQTLTAELAVVYRLVDSLAWLDVGLVLGAGGHLETVGAQGYSGLSGTGAATVAAGVRLPGGWGPQLLVSGGGRVVELDGALEVRPHISATLGLGLEL